MTSNSLVNGLSVDRLRRAGTRSETNAFVSPKASAQTLIPSSNSPSFRSTEFQVYVPSG
ncbi:hypothetical protein [Nostoc sp.]|uniref:hypothetical protein n=1 Tax=Nostoc sp. TaxID=1180 RepID=UPI0030064BB7